MIAWLSRPNLKSILVLHINHPNEMDEHLAMALQKLIAAKITLLNQTVLLKGVNDQAAVLAELSEKLFNYGILPYYLHTLDKTAGTAHFDLTPEAISKICSDCFVMTSSTVCPNSTFSFRFPAKSPSRQTSVVMLVGPASAGNH